MCDYPSAIITQTVGRAMPLCPSTCVVERYRARPWEVSRGTAH